MTQKSIDTKLHLCLFYNTFKDFDAISPTCCDHYCVMMDKGGSGMPILI